MADVSSYIDIRDWHQTASDKALEAYRDFQTKTLRDEALEAYRAFQTLRDEAEELANQELAARAEILAAEKDAITARAVLFDRGEDTSDIDEELASFAEALGRYSAQIKRLSFAEARAAARGE